MSTRNWLMMLATLVVVGVIVLVALSIIQATSIVQSVPAHCARGLHRRW